MMLLWVRLFGPVGVMAAVYAGTPWALACAAGTALFLLMPPIQIQVKK
jgi:hypothetical protein